LRQANGGSNSYTRAASCCRQGRGRLDCQSRAAALVLAYTQILRAGRTKIPHSAKARQRLLSGRSSIGSRGPGPVGIWALNQPVGQASTFGPDGVAHRLAQWWRFQLVYASRSLAQGEVLVGHLRIQHRHRPLRRRAALRRAQSGHGHWRPGGPQRLLQLHEGRRGEPSIRICGTSYQSPAWQRNQATRGIHHTQSRPPPLPACGCPAPVAYTVAFGSARQAESEAVSEEAEAGGDCARLARLPRPAGDYAER